MSSKRQFMVTRDDGAYLVCDRSRRPKPGEKVCILYPLKTDGEKRQASWAGTLKSLSRKSGIAWVVFLEAEWKITRRIDLRDGCDVVRVVGEMVPELIREATP